MRRAPLTLLMALLGAALVLAGCTTLPQSGGVHHERASADTTADEAPYFAPPGPATGATRAQIVTGFLVAMQANPLGTAVARSFLAADARSSWEPNKATMFYEAYTVDERRSDVIARLSDAHRLDERGGWVESPPGRTDQLDLQLVQEDGEWRIENPPNALIVQASFLQSRFVPFNLYFFDQTNQVLVPDTVLVPRGEQTATNLVRALLTGPSSDLAPVVRSAFPRRTDLDLSVVVSDSGVAELPLTAEMLKLTPAELTRAVVQLAWTLRQVPGISRARITVDGAPVPLANGNTSFSVDDGAQYDPAGSNTSQELIALREGRVVNIDGDTVKSLGGPFGRGGYALRSVAVSQDNSTVAAVAADGRSALVGPRAVGGPVRRVLRGGTNLLRPSYDRFADLWLVDRTAAGARVHLVHAGRDRVLGFPGISGRNVTAFVVSRDGTRLVAALGGGVRPVVVSADILRAGSGLVTRATRARSIQVPGNDLGQAVDISWVGPTTLGLLTRTASSRSQVVLFQTDGAPVDRSLPVPETLAAPGKALAGGPDRDLPVRVISSDKKLYELTASGQWAVAPASIAVLAAAYPG